MGLFDDLEAKGKEWAGNIEKDLEEGGVDKLQKLGSKEGMLEELEETEPGKYKDSKDDSQDDSGSSDSDDSGDDSDSSDSDSDQDAGTADDSDSDTDDSSGGDDDDK